MLAMEAITVLASHLAFLVLLNQASLTALVPWAALPIPTVPMRAAEDLQLSSSARPQVTSLLLELPRRCPMN